MNNDNRPIQQTERSMVVDVLRGFALGGVIIANLISFSSFAMPSDVAEKLSSTSLDHTYELIMAVFVDNKFITLFSLLFGYGFGVIMERINTRDINVTTFFMRRMIVLLAAGIIHLAVWWGEVLHAYAFCGFFLFCFRRASNKTLLISAVVLLLVPTTFVRYLQIKQNIFIPANNDPVFKQYLSLSLSSNVSDIALGNYTFYNYVFIKCLHDCRDIFEILAKFLLGYLVLRKGYLKDLAMYIASIRRVLYVALIPACLYIALMVFFINAKIKLDYIPLRLFLFGFYRLGILSLSTVYACSVILIYYQWPHAKVVSAFRYIGMMSLTNYLTHTLIFIILFTGLGFGLLGKVHLFHTLLIGMGIFAAQVFISKWWLSRYQYGPAEWLWRQLSYWKVLPITKAM